MALATISAPPAVVGRCDRSSQTRCECKKGREAIMPMTELRTASHLGNAAQCALAWNSLRSLREDSYASATAIGVRGSRLGQLSMLSMRGRARGSADA